MKIDAYGGLDTWLDDIELKCMRAIGLSANRLGASKPIAWHPTASNCERRSGACLVFLVRKKV